MHQSRSRNTVSGHIYISSSSIPPMGWGATNDWCRCGWASCRRSLSLGPAGRLHSDNQRACHSDQPHSPGICHSEGAEKVHVNTNVDSHSQSEKPRKGKASSSKLKNETHPQIARRNRIHNVKGNYFDAEEHYLVHPCDCHGGHPEGLAEAMFAALPDASTYTTMRIRQARVFERLMVES